ncbi:hypothetical protein KFK09_017374 [Dendrobium nobile]|uniref:Uncharacterized protein n=1 Tax=Dendrobium nobile TaxID=94219 RepID=A0A8T3B778_DENNO|nr:hypothetical protein KFK09_017374 [Dendrobium nobile]
MAMISATLVALGWRGSTDSEWLGWVRKKAAEAKRSGLGSQGLTTRALGGRLVVGLPSLARWRQGRTGEA